MNAAQLPVLVTGGAGYIGAHTCKALAQAGYLPVCYDNLSAGHRHAVRWGPFESGDIGDRARLDEVITRWKPVAMLHFAAHAYVGESVEDPGKYYRNNVAGSLTLLETLRDHGISQLVFSSSCATYGIPEALPITEGTDQRPINPYGATKLMTERMIADFGAAHGLRAVILRYFNAAGADADGEIGEDHTPETHLIPLVLDVAAGTRPHVTVFGDDYDTPDGTCVRDYVHVSDLAAAHVLALTALRAGLGSVSCNLGTGKGFSVREIIGSVERVTGRKVPVVIGRRRSGDPAVLIAEARQAKSLLGWSARYRDIDEIVHTAWVWHQRSRD